MQTGERRALHAGRQWSDLRALAAGQPLPTGVSPDALWRHARNTVEMLVKRSGQQPAAQRIAPVTSQPSPRYRRPRVIARAPMNTTENAIHSQTNPAAPPGAQTPTAPAAGR